MGTDLKGKVVGIAVVDGLLDGLHPDDGHDRAEGLLPGDPHVSSDMIDQGGPDQVLLALVGGEEGGTLGLRILHQPLDEVCGGLTDHWGDGSIILHA